MNVASPTTDLARKTLKGILWSALTFAAGKGITFLSTVILARLLTPDDFGLMALGLLAIAYIDTFGELGVGNVVIYRRDNLEENSSVAFTLGLLVNFSLMTIAFFIAPPVAAFFNEPRLIEILRALSLTLFISGLGTIHQARLNRELQFKKTFLPETGKTLAKAIVSITLAWMGWGVWSLVWGQIAANLTATALYWFSFRWWPRLTLKWEIVRQQLSYSSHLLLVEIMAIIRSNLDYVIIGRRFDTTSLGYYTMAYRVPELLIIFVCSAVSKALFPAFSSVQDRLETLQRGYLNTLRYMALYSVPVGVGMALVTSEFITVAYGGQWLPSIPIMQVLSLYAVMYSLAYHAGDIYKATGRPDILSKTSMLDVAIGAPLLWVGAGYGIFYVAVAHLLANTIMTTIKLTLVVRLVRLRFGDIFRALQPALTASAVMLMGLVALRPATMSLSPLLRLVLLSSSGGLLYVAALWLFHREVAAQGMGLIRHTFFKRLEVGGVQR
jgi:PST family polysaccharide transporter